MIPSVQRQPLIERLLVLFAGMHSRGSPCRMCSCRSLRASQDFMELPGSSPSFDTFFLQSEGQVQSLNDEGQLAAVVGNFGSGVPWKPKSSWLNRTKIHPLQSETMAGLLPLLQQGTEFITPHACLSTVLDGTVGHWKQGDCPCWWRGGFG